MSEERLPPQNTNAEQSVIGAMLLNRNALTRGLELLSTDSFYRDSHRTIYDSMKALYDKNEPVDIVTVTNELRSAGKLETVGGSVYISDLLNSVPTAANMDYYAKIVEEKHMLRRLIDAGTRMVTESFESSAIVTSVLDNAEKTIFEIAMNRDKRDFHKVDNILKEVLDRIDQLYEKKGSITGCPSGFPDLDKYTAGFQNSELIIVAARPSVGKTALALNFAAHAAIKNKIPVGIFSLEMSKEQLAQRMLCAEAEVDAQRLRTASLSDSGWKRLTKAIGRISEAPIFIDDSPVMTAMEMRAKARRLKIEHGIGMVLVDYLQLMQGKSSGEENRVQVISEIARGLKTLARELDVPVIALSQLSRGIEQRQDRIPRLSDLRDSGEIEQTADVVLFIHREDYYNPGAESGNLADIIIAKQRNGPTGKVELVFRKEFTKFESKSQYEDKP
jgi:replicative DNA helicase